MVMFCFFVSCFYDCRVLNASDHNQRILEEQLCDEARQQMKPELKACEDFKCIENVLYEEGERALDKYLDSYAVPHDVRIRKRAQWSDLKAYNPLFYNDYYPRPGKQLHDEKTLGAALVNKTKKFLQQGGVNPDAVKIYADSEYFSQNSNAIAAAGSMTDKTPSYIKFNLQKSHLINDHVIAHEAIHTIELHHLKLCFFRINKNLNNVNELDRLREEISEYAFTDWRREHEKQAELFPVLRFKSKKVFPQLKQRYLHRCITESLAIVPNVDPKRTHPTCMELLSYMVRISDIENKAKELANVKNS